MQWTRRERKNTKGAFVKIVQLYTRKVDTNIKIASCIFLKKKIGSCS